MKILLILSLLFSFSLSQAATHALKSGQNYLGDEYLNNKPTGKQCYVVIDFVTTNDKGMHCYDINWRYASQLDFTPKEPIMTSSRVTNYHRSEYPELKTCALNINGTSYGNEIYQENTNILYNEIYVGYEKIKRKEHHYFLSLSPETKLLTRAKIRILSWFTKKDIDCLNLELL